MDRQIAEFALNASFRASRELLQLLETAYAHCPPEEYRDLKSRIAMAMAEIGQVKDWAFKTHPDLETVVEQRLEKYERFC